MSHSLSTTVNASLTTEIKTRARLWLKLLESKHVAAIKHARILSRKNGWTFPEVWQLQHCLNLAAADAGFQHWEHARVVLSGEAKIGDDIGDFWHGAEVAGLTNLWYASYADALAQLQADADHYLLHYLLPYRTQFMLVSEDYLQALGLSTDADLWPGRDLVQAYGSDTWLTLAQQRLQATRTERLHASWNATQTELDLQSSEAEAQRVMTSFVKQGRLLKIPEQRKKRLVILRWLVAQLETGKRYAETDINQFFLQFHEDYATLRREMIINALMMREDGVYWRV